MGQVAYLSTPYYVHWIAAIETLMAEKGVTEAVAPPPGLNPALPKDMVATVLATGASCRIEAETPPRFQPGDKVMAKNINPPTHTRLPRYIRGKMGVVQAQHGGFAFADTRAHGLGEKPQHVYSVRFSAQELWARRVRPMTRCISICGTITSIRRDDREQREMSDAAAAKSDAIAEPAFAEPWQAQAFAMTMELSKRGAFTWGEWVEVFSTEIRAHPAQPGEDATEAYYRQWLAALETILTTRGLSTPTEISGAQELWRQAYLNTPHGLPVALKMPASTVATIRSTTGMTTITATPTLSPPFGSPSPSARPRFRPDRHDGAGSSRRRRPPRPVGDPGAEVAVRSGARHQQVGVL